MNIPNFLKHITFIFILIILTSCATPSHISLKPESRQYITSTDVNIGLDQQEINADINRSNISTFTGGGLIFALIDSAVDNSRAKKAESSMQPIRDALLNYDFGNSFADNIDSELKSVDWLNVKKVTLVHDTSSESYKKSYSLSKASAVLFISIKYSFSPDFKALKILSDVKLFPKNEELKSFAYSWNDGENPINDKNCIYKNTLERVKSLSKESATEEEAIMYWAEDDAMLVREALESGANEMAKMIASDLNGN